MSICHRKSVDLHLMVDPLLKDAIKEHCDEYNLKYKSYVSRLIASDLKLALDQYGNVIDYETELKCIDKQLEILNNRKNEIKEVLING